LFATDVVDTGGKFAAGVVDTGGDLPPMLLTTVQFLWNSFLSKEAVAAERRYEKETSTCIQVAFRARTYLLSPLPRPTPTPASNGRDKRGRLALLPAPPLSTRALPRLNLCDFQRPRPKARMASI
jgi:hypothetical protein